MMMPRNPSQNAMGEGTRGSQRSRASQRQVNPHHMGDGGMHHHDMNGGMAMMAAANNTGNLFFNYQGGGLLSPNNVMQANMG